MDIYNTIIVLSAKYLYLVSLVIFFLYFLRQPRSTQKEIAWLCLFALPIIFIISRIAGLLYFDPRPFVSGGFTPLIPHVADNGFPSDHTLLSAVIASIIYFYNRKVGTVLFILALTVGLARVLAGVHHIVDIIGSIVIAATITALVYYFILPRFIKKQVLEKSYL